MIDETGAQAAETADDDQGAAYWRARAVSESARADQAEARAEDAEASLRFIANAVTACRAVPGPV